VRNVAEDGQARASLGFLTEPGDLTLGALLRVLAPAEILAAVSAGDRSGPDPLSSCPEIPGLGRAVERWRARRGLLPTPARFAAWEQDGLRLICPGDAEWPTQLDDLGEARPVVIWARGSADLRFACLRSVSMVGSRAATAYGRHVGTEMAAALAERGFTLISGGSKGSDSPATLTMATGQGRAGSGQTADAAEVRQLRDSPGCRICSWRVRVWITPLARNSAASSARLDAESSDILSRGTGRYGE
jgi:DNA processing protein